MSVCRKSCPVSRAYLLAVIVFASCFSAHGQPVQVRILFLNGNNGQPLKNVGVVVYDDSHLSKPSYLRTDGDGVVKTTAEHGALLRAFVERGFIRSCEDGSLAGMRSFDVNTIVSTGISEKSTCKTKATFAQPGMLIRVVRRSSFLEALGEN
jgi:hypothetical protein